MTEAELQAENARLKQEVNALQRQLVAIDNALETGGKIHLQAGSVQVKRLVAEVRVDPRVPLLYGDMLSDYLNHQKSVLKYELFKGLQPQIQTASAQGADGSIILRAHLAVWPMELYSETNLGPSASIKP